MSAYLDRPWSVRTEAEFMKTHYPYTWARIIAEAKKAKANMADVIDHDARPTKEVTT